VHLTGGILRHFRAFSTPEQNPALGVLSTPAHPQVTQTVSQPRAKPNASLIRKFVFTIGSEIQSQVFSGGVPSSQGLSLVFSKQVFKFLALVLSAFILSAKFRFGFIESQKSASRFFGFGFGQHRF